MAQVEKLFETRLKRWLESQGIYRLGTPQDRMHTEPCGYWEKRHGSMYTGAGLPDMHIVVHGVSLEVEVKAPNGKPSELQIQKLKQIDDAGCVGLILYPKDFEAFQKLVLWVKSFRRNPYYAAIYCGLRREWRE